MDFSNVYNFNFYDKEPSFYLIALISHWLLGDAVRGTLAIYALLGVALKTIGIYKLSRIPFLSLIFYISSNYFLQEFGQIRVGVASAIFLLAIPDIANKNYKEYLIKTIIAVLFHYSAIIMLPLYLLLNITSRRLIYILLPIFGVCLFLLNEIILHFLLNNISLLNLIPNIISNKFIIYLDLIREESNEISIFNSYRFSLILIYYFCLLNIWRSKSEIDVLLTKIFGFSLFIFYAFSFLPVFAYRLSEFLGITNIILFASIPCIFKQKKLVIFIMIIYSTIILYKSLGILFSFSID